MTFKLVSLYMVFLKRNLVIFLLFVFVNMFSQQNNLQNFTIKNGLPSNEIIDITQDKIGYLWIATNKGVVKFDGDDFTLINKQKTTTLFIKNNSTYLGLENEIIIKSNYKEQSFESKKVLKIASINDAIFVATIQGIYKVEKEYLKPLQINTEIDFSIINDIIFSNNSFYVATNKGLWNIDSLEKPKKLEKIIHKGIVSLTKFQEKIIVATIDNEIKIINKNIVEETISTQESISSVKKLKNEIWITSNKNGIEIYTLPSFSFKQKINKYNSLKTNTINTVFKDTKNTIWIASNKGLYSFKNSKKSTQNNSKPEIYFENLLVNHQNKDSLLNTKKVLEFLPSENNISFQFKTINLSQPKNIKYRYKLADKFSPWSRNNTVQFPNLNAGKYSFEIQSKINDNLSDIKSLSFKIDKPIYKKTWFIFGAIIFLLFTIYFLIDIYITQINKKNKAKVKELKLENHLLTLEQKALQLQMNPHFIFNVLNSIKALGNTGKTDELNSTISSFSKLLRSILNNSRLEEISLQNEIDSLKHYIVLEQQMNSKTFEYEVITKLNSIGVDEILIPPMLIQPFIENSIKHGFQPLKNGKIILDFEVKNRFLHCSIIDNGIGIEQSKKQKANKNHNSVALKISKERINNITGFKTFSIEEVKKDSVVKGTKVWFKIPLKTDY